MTQVKETEDTSKGKVADKVDSYGRPIEPEAKSTLTNSPGLNLSKDLDIKIIDAEELKSKAEVLNPLSTDQKQLLVRDIKTYSKEEKEKYDARVKLGPNVVTMDFINRARAKQIVIEPFDYIYDNGTVYDKAGKVVKTKIDEHGNTTADGKVIQSRSAKMELIKSLLRLNGFDSVQVERILLAINSIIYGS